jgi:PAS domain S-box-containing protein
MHGTEAAQRTLLAELDTLRQQTKMLAVENAKLRQHISDQQHSLSFLDAIIQELPTPIFVKDAQELRFVRLNKAGEALLGLHQTDIIGKTDFDFFPVAEATSFTGKDRFVLSRGQLEDIAEESMHTQSHGVRLLHTKKIPIYNEAGQPQYLLAISEDITERKGAEQSLQTYVNRLQTLTHLNRLVSSSLHMEDVLREMARATAKLMDAPLVILSIADATTQTLDVVAFSDEAMRPDCPIQTVRFGEGAYGWIAPHQRILNVANVFEDDRFSGLDWWERHHLQSYYGIPIVHQSTLIGVRSMMGHQPFRIGSVESTLLDSLMAQAIIAVEHARHVQAIQAQTEALSRVNQALEHEIAERKHAEACLQQAQEELEDHVHERTADLAQANHRLQAEIAERAHVEATLRQREIQLQHLTAIGRIMSASLDIQEVYQRFVEEMRQLVPFDRITLTHLDASHGSATVDYVWGMPVAGRGPGDVYPLAGTIAQEVARTAAGKIVLIDLDASICQTFSGSFSLEQSGLRSHLVHPLIMHDRVIGLLYLGAVQAHAYDERTLQLAESVSEHSTA